MNLDFIFNSITAITSILAICFTGYSFYSSKKQEFEINRGNVVVYIDYDIVNSQAFLVIKNFGKSIATISSIHSNIEIPFMINEEKYKLTNYTNYTLVPNQKFYSQIDISKIIENEISITCTYSTLGKTITETYKSQLSFSKSLSHFVVKLDDSTIQSSLTHINKNILLISQILK